MATYVQSPTNFSPLLGRSAARTVGLIKMGRDTVALRGTERSALLVLSQATSRNNIRTYLDRVLVEAEGEGLEEAGKVAQNFLVLQPEVEHDHVIHVVVRQQVEE